MKEISSRYCGGAPLSFDWANGPGGGYEKVFYYDALPARRPNQSDEQFEADRRAVEDLHAMLATIDRFRVNEGDTRYRRGRGLEQKKVDVMIAVDMLIHTIRRNMDRATLLAGDADFAPLLTALANEGMFVNLRHPPKASKDLLASADAREPLSVRLIHHWLDQPSRGMFGHMPGFGFGTRPTASPLWTNGDVSRGVWLNTPTNTVTAAWRTKDRCDWAHLAGQDWDMIRMVAMDDFGVEFPEQLPPSL